MRRLEGRLGVRLLNRTTRSVTPTEAGARLLERLAPALGAVAEALDAVNSFRDSAAGTLRLNVPTAVARLVKALALGARQPQPGLDHPGPQRLTGDPQSVAFFKLLGRQGWA